MEKGGDWLMISIHRRDPQIHFPLSPSHRGPIIKNNIWRTNILCWWVMTSAEFLSTGLGHREESSPWVDNKYHYKAVQAMTIKYEVLIFLKCSSGKLTDTWMPPLMRAQRAFEIWTVNNGTMMAHLKSEPMMIWLFMPLTRYHTVIKTSSHRTITTVISGHFGQFAPIPIVSLLVINSCLRGMIQHRGAKKY